MEIITNGEFAASLIRLNKSGISQGKLAEAMNVHKDTLCRWMKGFCPMQSRRRFMFLIQGLENDVITRETLKTDPMSITLAHYFNIFSQVKNANSVFDIYLEQPNKKQRAWALRYSKARGEERVIKLIIFFDFRCKVMLGAMMKKKGVPYIVIPNRTELVDYIKALQAILIKKGHEPEWKKNKALKEATGNGRTGRVTSRLNKLRATKEGRVTHTRSIFPASKAVKN